MRKFFILITIILFSCCISCSAQIYQSQGVLFYYTTSFSKGQIFKHRVWFQDSVLIFEAMIHKSYETQTDTGSTIKESFEVYKYKYLDLKTSKCQDYRNFSDTATMISNYYLKPDESIGIDLISGKCRHKVFEDFVDIGDTIMNMEKYKRMKIVDTFNSQTIYYLKCDGKKNIFRVNKTLEDKLKDCKVSRYELTDLNTYYPNYTFEYKIDTEELTNQEKNVFNKWRKNAQETRLPLITSKEAEEISARNVR